MLIDDNEIDNFINERLIKHFSFSEKVYVHTSTISALEFFKNLQKISPIPKLLIPDFIFLDLNMPIIDGWEFLREYEKLNFPLDCKIVVLTASISQEDKERSKTYNNVVEFLSKPLSDEMLNAL